MAPSAPPSLGQTEARFATVGGSTQPTLTKGHAMNQIEPLRAEIAELRESTRLLLAVITTALATTPDAAQAAKSLAGRLQAAEQAKPRSEAFWDAATGVLKMLTSSALQQHPNDADLLALHHGVRPNRH